MPTVVSEQTPEWALERCELGVAQLSDRSSDRSTVIEHGIACIEEALPIIKDLLSDESRVLISTKLGAAYLERKFEDRAENQDKALAAFQDALGMLSFEQDKQSWAIVTSNIGTVYAQRINGPRNENLDQAASSFESALEILTRDQNPFAWAKLNVNLGKVYRNRVSNTQNGDLERAITAFTNAIDIITHDVSPAEWASISFELGNAYLERVGGTRSDNAERALVAFKNVLSIWKKETNPYDWAAVQVALGSAYSQRVAGDRDENLEVAIASYNNALQVRSKEHDLAGWATVRLNLAACLAQRRVGDPSDNLEQAIDVYKDVFTTAELDTNNVSWAAARMNLGTAYSQRVRGDRSENIEMALEAYAHALQVRTHQQNPLGWAEIKLNQGLAFNERLIGERGDNLELAIDAFQDALTVLTAHRDPYQWVSASLELGAAYANRRVGKRLDNFSQGAAIIRQTRETCISLQHAEGAAEAQRALSVIDNAFLDIISQEFTEEEWVNKINEWRRPGVHTSIVTLRTGYQPKNDYEKLVDFAINPPGSKNMSKGERIAQNGMLNPRTFFASELKRLTLASLPKRAPNFEHITIRVLPSRELNASAVKMPSGAPAVLLDLFTLQVIPVILECFHCAVTRESDDPISTEYTYDEYIRSLTNLAGYCASGDERLLAFSHAMEVAIPQRFSGLIGSQSFLIQTFLLLHEYGHIVKGHLSDEHITTLRALPTRSVAIYENTTDQEFEADEFAFRILCQYVEEIGGDLRPAHIAEQIFVILAFFSLVEFFHKPSSSRQISATHPEALERLRRIATLVDMDRDSSAWFDFAEKWIDDTIRRMPFGHFYLETEKNPELRKAIFDSFRNLTSK